MTILQAIKANGPTETTNQHLLVFMVNDLDAQKVLGGWTVYKTPPIKDRELAPDEDYLVVGKRIWPRVDYGKLSRLSGVHLGAVMEVFHRLREARLVYPDGTANEQALRIVRAEVGATVRNMTGIRR
jgi:hypothetical protein